MLRGDEQQIEGDLVLKKRKIYVPKNKALKVEIIWLYHDILVTGHRGRQKIMELVTKNYWWPGVTRNVGKYIDRCDILENEEQNRDISREFNGE